MKMIAYLTFMMLLPMLMLNYQAPSTWNKANLRESTCNKNLRMYELENFIVTSVRESNSSINIDWTIIVLDSSSNLIASFGNIDDTHSMKTISSNNYSTSFEQESAITFLELARFYVENFYLDYICHIFGENYNNLNKAEDNINFSSIMSGKNLFFDTTFLGGIHPLSKYTVLVNARSEFESNSLHKAFYVSNIALNIMNYLSNKTVEYGKIIKIDDIYDILYLENGFVYFGRPTCPACVAFIPILFELALSTQTKVYYFNTDRWRSNPRFRDVLEKYNVRHVPHVIKIENGEIIIISDVGSVDWQLFFYHTKGY